MGSWPLAAFLYPCMCASVCDCACVLCVVCLCAVCACYLMYPGFIVLFPCCRCSCCRALNVHKLRSLSLLFALGFAFCAACWSCARFRLVLKPAKTPHMCLCRCLSQCVCVWVCLAAGCIFAIYSMKKTSPVWHYYAATAATFALRPSYVVFPATNLRIPLHPCNAAGTQPLLMACKCIKYPAVAIELLQIMSFQFKVEHFTYI